MTHSTTSAAPSGMTYTENGALSHVTNSSCLKFFTTVMARDKATAVPDETIRSLLADCWDEDPTLTLRLIAHLRDCREGKGERHAAGVALQWLGEHHPLDLVHNLQHLPFYGRWGDLLQYFAGTEFQTAALSMMAEQLRTDLALLRSAHETDDAQEARTLLGRISLCAKWAPTEGCTYDIKAGKAGTPVPSKELAELLSSGTDAMKQYRKVYLTPLRQATGVVESLLCAQKYTDVDFSRVPSVALKIYSAKCFPKHMAERFAEWQKDVLAGRAKANTSVVDPYEVVRLYMNRKATEAQKPTLEAFFKTQVAELKKKCNVGKTVCVVDVSGSMEGTPMEVAISLGVWISAMAEQLWNIIFTFHESPSVVDLSQCTTLEERINLVQHSPWGGNTNLQATFDLMLARAQRTKLTTEDMPERLVIISDMQFDQACGSNCWTNLETIRAKYRKAGYTMPQIVFWNVRGNTGTGAAPAQDDEKGVIMLSGFSKNLIPILISGEKIPTPYETMVAAVNAERYQRVKCH